MNPFLRILGLTFGVVVWYYICLWLGFSISEQHGPQLGFGIFCGSAAALKYLGNRIFIHTKCVDGEAEDTVDKLNAVIAAKNQFQAFSKEFQTRKTQVLSFSGEERTAAKRVLLPVLEEFRKLLETKHEELRTAAKALSAYQADGVARVATLKIKKERFRAATAILEAKSAEAHAVLAQARSDYLALERELAEVA